MFAVMKALSAGFFIALVLVEAYALD